VESSVLFYLFQSRRTLALAMEVDSARGLVLCDITNMSMDVTANLKVDGIGKDLPPNQVCMEKGTAQPPESEDMELSIDGDDPQNVAEYAHEIFGTLGEEEKARLPEPNFMHRQPHINARMRVVLLDWMVEVHMKYKLSSHTLFLTANIVDRYLEKRHVARNKLQLVGVAAVFIAAKFEEIYPPEASDFVYITDNTYAKEEILAMEVSILVALDFCITGPTAMHFLDRYQARAPEIQRHLSRYFLELTLLDIKMCQYTPSHRAATAILLSNKLLGQKRAWSTQMLRHTGYTEQELKDCTRELCHLVDIAGHPAYPYPAVRKKFSQVRFLSVATKTFL